MSSQLALNVSTDRKRAAVRLAQSLEKNLLAYFAVAGAGFLVSASPTQAEIVYTPSNIPMAQGFAGGALTQLDLNHDGKTDFTFSNYSYETHGLGGFFLKVLPGQPGNEVWGIKLAGQRQVTAAALPAGAEVGSKANFASYPQGLNLAVIGLGSSGFASGGWSGVETAYLGLKFVFNGEVHYGWARIKFVYPGGAGFLTGSIYGYAYESVPNQPILTGKTSGSAETPKSTGSVVPATTNPPLAVRPSLGTLAAGAPGMAAWHGKTTSRSLAVDVAAD